MASKSTSCEIAAACIEPSPVFRRLAGGSADSAISCCRDSASDGSESGGESGELMGEVVGDFSILTTGAWQKWRWVMVYVVNWCSKVVALLLRLCIDGARAAACYYCTCTQVPSGAGAKVQYSNLTILEDGKWLGGLGHRQPATSTNHIPGPIGPSL